MRETLGLCQLQNQLGPITCKHLKNYSISDKVLPDVIAQIIPKHDGKDFSKWTVVELDQILCLINITANRLQSEGSGK